MPLILPQPRQPTESPAYGLSDVYSQQLLNLPQAKSWLTFVLSEHARPAAENRADTTSDVDKRPFFAQRKSRRHRQSLLRMRVR